MNSTLRLAASHLTSEIYMFGKQLTTTWIQKSANSIQKYPLRNLFFGSYQPHQWNNVFELIKEIQEDFKKGVRYPTVRLRKSPDSQEATNSL
jgi:hypothetical protein